MTDTEKQALIDELCRILLRAIGQDHGITINELTDRLGLSLRRTTEQLIQHNLRSLPCLIVADTNGVYRPTAADQINSYITSLRKRHRPLVDREKITITKARAAGWPQNADGLFLEHPNSQPDLFI